MFSAPVWLTAPTLVTDRFWPTEVAPKLVVPVPVVVVVRPLVAPVTVPLATRLPPAERTVLPVVVSDTVNALVSVICV
ncbi:MAG: hypothetical protein ACKO9Z_10130, partial [Planctomycetota bacterium]